MFTYENLEKCSNNHDDYFIVCKPKGIILKWMLFVFITIFIVHYAETSMQNYHLSVKFHSLVPF